MKIDRIPYETILRAKYGDPEAMKMVLRHYSRYISHYSKRPFYDSYGNCLEIVDEDIRQRIEAKLMFQIIYKFDASRLPDGEILEQ